ncbi:MAG: hypothetical protein IH898_11760, partial [Planctomycetes bacterium]|nr:hypothetical protein [Planctomycetota bacterium]
ESIRRRPGVVGKYTNDIVYERLAPGVLDELRVRNPTDHKGRRRAKHHQWLSRDVKNLTGEVIQQPERRDIDANLNEQLIIEFYSR